MMRRKHIGIGLFCFLLTGCMFALFLWNNETSSGSVFTKTSFLQSQSVEGKLVQIENTYITIQYDQQHTQTFSLLPMHNLSPNIELQDIVRISYMHTGKIASDTILSITLVKKHGDELSQRIAQMSLAEKIGQMFLVRCPNEEHAQQDILTYHFGGYMLFDKDVKDETKSTLQKKIVTYQATSSLPLLIAIDEEGGTVNRLSKYTAFRGVPFHSPQSLFQEGGMPLIQSDSKEKAELLLSLGINLNFAPVADVSTNPQDFIYPRTFGQSAEATATYIEQYIQSAAAAGIGTTLKHFPGYGNNRDTHTGIAYDQRPLAQFYAEDFLPFETGIQAGSDAVLVSHTIVTSMDAVMPASLSPTVHAILRNQLHFDGVIMSDDLDMDAIKNVSDFNTAAIMAIQAGNDLILCSNYAQQIPAVIAAVQDGRIAEASIDTSVYRILKMKQKLHIL